MYSLMDIYILNLSLIYQNLVMVNDLNSSYMLARRFNGKYIEVKFFRQIYLNMNAIVNHSTTYVVWKIESRAQSDRLQELYRMKDSSPWDSSP